MPTDIKFSRAKMLHLVRAQNPHGEVLLMLARIAIFSALALSIGSADNFMIKDSRGADSFFNVKVERGGSNASGHGDEKAPEQMMRVIVEDVNPNSELGQAIRYVLNEADAKEKAKIAQKAASKKPKKKVVKKKVVKKADDSAKPAPQEHIMEMSQMPSGEVIKAKEAPVVHDKPADGGAKKDEHAAHPKEAAPKDAHAPAKKDEHAAPAKPAAH